MKTPSIRQLVFTSMLAFTLAFMNPIAHSEPTPAPAPAGTASNETDKETGKSIITTPTGLKYVELKAGTGPAIKTGDHVVVKYVGKLLDGTKFDASADHGGEGTFDYVQGVTGLIAGWTEGTSTMKVGGKRKLIIPPQLGYGMQGAGDAVPPNATLIFEIELVAVKSN